MTSLNSGSHAVVIGGRAEDWQVSAKVEKLDISKSKWSPMPDLQVARESHASCTAQDGNIIYVFCGFNADGGVLNSIEKLAPSFDSKPTAWKLLDLPLNSLEPRAFPAVAPLNDREIVLMGGRCTFNLIGDVHILDTRTDQLQLVLETNEKYLEFQAYGHQVGRLRKNKVVALVEDEERDPYMIQFDRKANSLNVFRAFGRKRVPVKPRPQTKPKELDLPDESYSSENTTQFPLPAEPIPEELDQKSIEEPRQEDPLPQIVVEEDAEEVEEEEPDLVD